MSEPDPEPASTSAVTAGRTALLYACIHDGRDPAGVMRRLNARASRLGATAVLGTFDVGPLHRPGEHRLVWRRAVQRIEAGGVDLLIAPCVDEVAPSPTAQRNLARRLSRCRVAAHYLRQTQSAQPGQGSRPP